MKSKSNGEEINFAQILRKIERDYEKGLIDDTYQGLGDAIDFVDERDFANSRAARYGAKSYAKLFGNKGEE